MYDHVRPADADHPDGIYRVVGTGSEAVTLLRVADGDGRRVNTGAIVTVGYDELDGFDSVENPDANRSLGGVVGAALETAYWSGRAFVQQLAAHPLPTAVGLAFLLVGAFGGGTVPVPDVVLAALVLVGGFGLAYVGSGRL